METVFEKKDMCCGCTACVTICPQQAISMVEDECGFFYPQINKEKCIDCGLCKKACHFNKEDGRHSYLQVKVAKHKDKEVVAESRSGGAFTAISDVILAEGGVVYGAVLDDDLVVRHHRADNAEMRNKCRKSKYVQSDITGIFQQVKQDLESGKKVLFSGTGCQCDGLKSFVKNSNLSDEKLFLCDIVCHGVSSPAFFKKYLNYQEEMNNSVVWEFYFRDKGKYKWWECVEKLVFKNEKKVYSNEYANTFFENNLRLSCFNCSYTSLSRAGDITIGDCWGAERIYPNFANRGGASLLLINTIKGQQLFNKIVDKMDFKNIDIETVLQPRLKEHAVKPQAYDIFWSDYHSLDFNDFMKKWGRNDYSTTNIFLSKIKFVFKLPFRVLRKIWRIGRRIIGG